MDVVLVTLTAISLSLAIAMGVILLRTLREERQRSDARVALLSAAASAAPQRPDGVNPAPAARGRIAEDRVVGDLFTVSEEQSPWPRRIGAAAALAAVVALGAYVWVQSSGTPAAQQAMPAAAPLELLALEHLQEKDAFTVSGTVRNPDSGVPMADVVVTASLSDPDGTIVASGRATLDYRTLAPGDASPFVVKVPVDGSVSRYRIGFRTPDGTVVSHVDRRTDGSARAVNQGGGSPWAR
jgi:hypothetical protein